MTLDTLETENYECGDNNTSQKHIEHCTINHGEETICRMDDNRLLKNIVFGIMDGQNKRGNQAGNGLMTSWIGARKTSTLVPERHPLTQQDGTGLSTVEAARKASIGHQRA